MERTINVEINGQFVRKDNKNGGVMGEGNVTTLHITFDDSWKNYGKRIVWRDANGEHPVSIVLMELAAAGSDTLVYDTKIPAEPLAVPGWCSFSIEGYREKDGVHVVSFSVSDYLMVAESDSYNKPAEPTPSQTQQILEELGKTQESVKASATESKSWAVGGTGSRPGEDTDNSKYYSQKAKDSEISAEQSSVSSKQHSDISLLWANQSKAAKDASEKARDESKDNAISAESWAQGGTGTRPGEDTDNAEYWADRAQAYAQQASVPPVQGVYNVILTDSVTGDRYALVINDGVLTLLGVSNTLDATTLSLVDATTGVAYGLIVENGVLKLKEVS